MIGFERRIESQAVTRTNIDGSIVYCYSEPIETLQYDAQCFDKEGEIVEYRTGIHPSMFLVAMYLGMRRFNIYADRCMDVDNAENLATSLSVMRVYPAIIMTGLETPPPLVHRRVHFENGPLKFESNRAAIAHLPILKLRCKGVILITEDMTALASTLGIKQ